MGEGFFKGLFSRGKGGNKPADAETPRQRPSDFFRDAQTGLGCERDDEIQRELDATGYSQTPRPWKFLRPVTVEEIRNASWREVAFPNAFSQREKGPDYDDWQVFETEIPGFDGSVKIFTLPDDAKLKVVRREQRRFTSEEMGKPPVARYTVRIDMQPPAVNRTFLGFAYHSTHGVKKLAKIFPAAELMSASPIYECEFEDGQIISKEQALKAGFNVAMIEEK